MWEIVFFIYGALMYFGASFAYKKFIEKKWPIRVPLVIQRGKARVWDLEERDSQKA